MPCYHGTKVVSEIAPCYPKAERGRPPIPLETMLRVYFLQQWNGYSDPGMEDALYDNVSLRRFASLQPGQAPDEFTICKFRYLLRISWQDFHLFHLKVSTNSGPFFTCIPAQGVHSLRACRNGRPLVVGMLGCSVWATLGISCTPRVPTYSFIITEDFDACKPDLHAQTPRCSSAFFSGQTQ